MRILEFLLRTLVWVTLVPWWMFVCWSVVGGSFRWEYLSAVVLPLVFGIGRRTVSRKIERDMTEEELLERYHRQWDRRKRFSRAKARTRWRQ